MKKYRVVLLLMLFLLTTCGTAKDDQFSEFVQPDPETYVKLMPLIREYFFYRKQAVLNGEMDRFYDRYPVLQDRINIDQGINLEANEVYHMQSLAPFDGNILPEHYEKIRVRETEGEIQVLVHGMALYLWKDSAGMFEESGGEFMMVIFLNKEGGEWQVYKTDEVTLKEWKGLD